MNSCLYRCRVLHSRSKPKRHRFEYPCFLFCLDLDELPELDRRLLAFSHNRPNLYALRDGDHLRERHAASIRENLVAFLRARGFEHDFGQILLVTNLRVWGHVFNPVSFYFVHDAEQQLVCAVAEVANTFNEQKLYLVQQRQPVTGNMAESLPKRFYISPFSELDTTLDFNLARPEEALDLRISEKDDQGTFFFSSLRGQRLPLTNASLLRYSLRFPFMTLQIVAAIHWQAARLALKKVPYFRKNDRPELQTETRPYLKEERQNAI